MNIVERYQAAQKIVREISHEIVSSQEFLDFRQEVVDRLKLDFKHHVDFIKQAVQQELESVILAWGGKVSLDELLIELAELAEFLYLDY